MMSPCSSAARNTGTRASVEPCSKRLRTSSFMPVETKKKGTKTPAFDQPKLAAALTAATSGRMKADPNHLVISEITFSDGDKTVVVGNGLRKFRCDLSGAGVCTEVIAAGAKPAEQNGGGRGGVVSLGGGGFRDVAHFVRG